MPPQRKIGDITHAIALVPGIAEAHKGVRTMTYELITFGLAGQLFGLDIMAIREIRAWSPVTRLPNAPDHVTGVVNLRGAVLPVIDLSLRLGWKAIEATERNPIIVIEYKGQLRGLMIDNVHDIVSIEPATLQQPDAGIQEPALDCLQGVAPLGEDLLILLDLAKLMAADELDLAA